MAGARKVHFDIDGRRVPLQIRTADGQVEVSVDGAPVTVFETAGGGYLQLDGRIFPYFSSRLGTHVQVWIRGRTYRFEVLPEESVGAVSRGGAVVAPMPGTIFQVLVAVGDTVVNGQALVVMESMKMELTVAATGDGRIAEILCAAGELVDTGATLVKMENADG